MNAAKAVGRVAAVATAQVAETGVILNDLAQANKYAKLPAEALKFTSADAMIRSATRAE